jgi:ubiquinone/menaquinone biosynthesis C-methylase UbiE
MVMKPPALLPFFFGGKHYDQRWKHLTADLPFWVQQARKSGDPVLELACGTGRVALHLASAGFRVTGIDISDSMLGEARRKASQAGLAVEWVQADIRNFALERHFPLIIFPFNTIAILWELEDLETCLTCVKRHLAPGGRFIVDVFTPDFHFLVRNPTERFPHAEYPDPDGRGTIVVTESNVYDAARQINRVKFFFKFPGQAEEVAEEIEIRIYFPQELDALLKYNGFAIESKFGDYDGTAFRAASPKQLVVCSARM